ncbi:MAG: Gfo/Idh/MocA family oxidoreductase [Candidatus Rokubacteria bacterium]|nr:Gfo/Idh/MocA family oxidoreductase [Candidatus Rokubacteria bacterium]
MKPLGLAVLGCGWIARRHAAAARRLRGEVAVSFASRDPARAEAYRAEFHGVGAYGSYAAAVADPAVDAVIVCTPHDQHLPCTLLAVAHGKHVLVEKPIARTLAEADAMIRAARAAGVTLMVAENFRFMPAYRAVRALVADRAFGTLRQIHVTAWGDRGCHGWRSSRDAMGGGTLIDGGVHYVDLLLQWGGRATRVFALAPPNVLAGMGGEDTASLVVEFAGGTVGFLSNSLAAPGIPRLQWSTLMGSDGTLFVDNRGRFLWLRSRRGRRVRFFLGQDWRGHGAMLAEFVAALASSRAPEMDGVEARRDLAVVVAAYRSMQTGLPADVEWEPKVSS